MLTLKNKLKQQQANQAMNNNNDDRTIAVAKDDQIVPIKRVSVRDKLLVKEVQEMYENLPSTCSIDFEDSNKLHDFHLVVCPDDGYWSGGSFRFHVTVNDDYNISPPHVKCQTRLWHPNISEEGDVCLSLLRQSSIDGLGWAPTRHLKDVVWGLNSLFSDLLNFDDPLNLEAAEQHQHDKNAFRIKVTDYVKKYASAPSKPTSSASSRAGSRSHRT